MKLRRTTTGLGTEYRTPDGSYRIWREPYAPRHWYVQQEGCDETEHVEGFETLGEARIWLENRLAKTKRPHRWGGAGYVCVICGAIKDTIPVKQECPGSGKTGFDLWLYHAGAGWWRDESGVETHQEASRLLARKIGSGNVVAGAVLPAGQPLGLFTRRSGA